MGFTNLYTRKDILNPKDIDFAGVGTRVKNKIPDAAINAFRAKVPGPQAKPFIFEFEKDPDTGKLQISVKQMGFVYGWMDESFVANKSKMISVEVEIEGWRAHVQQSIDTLAKHRGEFERLTKKVEALEGKAASKEVDVATQNELKATQQEIQKLMSDAKPELAAIMQFWNSGPKDGVMALIKKHGLPVDQIGGEKRDADAHYALLQQAAKKFQDQYMALGKQVEALHEQAFKLTGKLFQTVKKDRAGELEGLEEAIQKRIGEFQGYKNADFTEVRAKVLLNEAKEFMSKSGATWTKLSANPAELDKTTAQVQQVSERLRVLGGRVLQEYQPWQKSTIPRGGNMPKYQQMLKMVYEEYEKDYNTLQATLQEYKQALLKQKPKAVELAAKSAKATVKAQAKVAKAEAKAAKKGK